MQIMSMGSEQNSTTGGLTTLFGGAIIGAAGLAWWLLSEAERRRRQRGQEAMLYAPRLQDGSEAQDLITPPVNDTQLEAKVASLNSAIADVRRQLEKLGGQE